MHVKIVFSLCFIGLLSCTQVNSSGEKSITKGDDTISTIEISTSKVAASDDLPEMNKKKFDELLFKASGTEPGWFAEIYEHKIRVVTDYGKDSLLLVDQILNGLHDNNGFELRIKENTDERKNIEIHLINKPCIADGSGDKMDRTVTILYKGKIYRGCGSFF